MFGMTAHAKTNRKKTQLVMGPMQKQTLPFSTCHNTALGEVFKIRTLLSLKNIKLMHKLLMNKKKRFTLY